jgi:hypothetical protein
MPRCQPENKPAAVNDEQCRKRRSKSSRWPTKRWADGHAAQTRERGRAGVRQEFADRSQPGRGDWLGITLRAAKTPEKISQALYYLRAPLPMTVRDL